MEKGELHEQLRAILADAQDHVPRAQDAGTLDELELQYLGRKQGKLTAILRQLGGLPLEERKTVGEYANEVKVAIEAFIRDKRLALQRSRAANLAETEWIDVTAPGIRPPRGSTHPISGAIRDITAIFERIGFVRVRHPEVDSDFYAFEALNMPAEHPARDEWETFYVRPETRDLRPENENDSHVSSLLTPLPLRGASKSQVSSLVLTPHTSNGQVREMEKGILPIRMINIGKCYRRQIDATHTPMFHQFEGFLVDREVAITNLKGTLDYFVQAYFGPDRRTRIRPYHFQFTEPSFEIDISCSVCGGTGADSRKPIAHPDRSVGADSPKCRTCKSGWLELGGAGMVHPNVLKAGGVDPKTHAGFAFGWGVERVLMMKAGISDIRLLYGNDLRWL